MPYLNVSTNVLLVVVGIGLLIFVHELGHFLMAKKIGVRVLAFSLGFGPCSIEKTVGRNRISALSFSAGWLCQACR
ncbi:MAG: site-2 protease family protein [Candidatus Brocadia sp.]|nr:MAG: site-2 protease family protein [Candidatus Brocadia sp.]